MDFSGAFWVQNKIVFINIVEKYVYVIYVHGSQTQSRFNALPGLKVN